MFPCTDIGYGYGWVFPVIMIGMMVLCFLMMRGRMGSRMCMPRGHRTDAGSEETGASASLDILNRRYARGEIDKEEYEEKKTLLFT